MTGAVDAFGLRPRARTRLGRCFLLVAAALAAGCWAASAQSAGPLPAAAPEQVEATNAPAGDVPILPASAGETVAPTNAVAEVADAEDSGTNGLRLNFHNAPLDQVLKYLSDAAGFIIELDAPVRGNVSVISSHPMTKDEAVDLLNSVLNKNGYAAIRSGERTLKIMDKSAAKSANNPVRIGSDPSAIPNNDEMVTQIIPLRYVESGQLVTDLSPFVSPQATIIANQAGNSIVITDTQANIRHLAEIIKAIDSSAEDVTEVKVFHLQFADPTEMANLLSGLFPDQSNTAQAPIRFGGRGGGGGGGRGAFFAAMQAASRGGGGNPQNDRIKKRNQVVAVADPRTSSVVVTATQDLMDQITEMIDQLDHPSLKAMGVAVIPIKNGDSQAILQSLQDAFGGNNTRNRNTGTQTDPFTSRVQRDINNNSSSTLGTGIGTGRRNSGGSSF
jgi:type II secretory pathway component GspD/PulD (secretin)